MYQKRQISGGVQNRETKNSSLGTIVTPFQGSKLSEKQISPTFSYFLINNALLYHFLANWLAHNKKMTEKSVSRSLKPWNDVTIIPVKFDAFGTSKQREGKSLSKFFFSIHIGTLGRFNQANKKKTGIYTSRWLPTGSPNPFGTKHLGIFSSSKSSSSLLYFSHFTRAWSGIGSSQSALTRHSCWKICFPVRIKGAKKPRGS